MYFVILSGLLVLIYGIYGETSGLLTVLFPYTTLTY